MRFPDRAIPRERKLLFMVKQNSMCVKSSELRRKYGFFNSTRRVIRKSAVKSSLFVIIKST